MLVVEIDGGYHEQTFSEDLRRQEYLQQLGWTVIRFTVDDVEQDAEAVGRAIAKELNLPYEYKKRKATGAGMKSVRAAKKRKPK
jgi:leucyl-tRNA synthetase